VLDIGARLGVADRARTVVADMRRALEPRPAESDDRPSILVEWWPRPVIAPGRKSWVHDLLELAGASNPLGEEDVKSRPLTDDEVRDLAPDAIVLSWCGVPFEKYRTDVVYGNPSWQGLAVLERRQVHCVAEAFLGRPSPRLIDGFRALREVARSALASRAPRETSAKL
jgi:iron complex transport system substrate-binding protein